MNCLVISCKIMKEEILQFQPEGTEFVFLEQSLHRTPEKLKDAVQQEIDRADDRDVDVIILAYGLCSNGIVGIRSKRHPVVIPRVHDCIALFFGSHERYMEEHRKEPGTYFLTKGWIEEGKSPLGIYEEYCGRYGKETAEWAMKEELKNYTRVVLVDTGLGLTEAHRQHALENARFFNLRFEELKGSLEYFEKMLFGMWKDGFLLLKPEEEVKQDSFL